MSQAAKAKPERIAEYLDHPQLKPFVRAVPAGQYLFRQGSEGNTMYIIADGTVWLVADKDGDEHVASVLERGQFLGEKSVMGGGKHTRFFSALAKTHATVIELALEDIDNIQRDCPELMIDMLRRMFLVAAQRLDRSNYMVRILRSSDNVQRLLELILYFSQSSGRTVAEGTEFLLSDDSIHFHVDMQSEEIEICLAELVRQKLIRRVVGDHFILKNPQALVDYGPKLKDHLIKMKGVQNGQGGGFSLFRRR